MGLTLLYNNINPINTLIVRHRWAYRINQHGWTNFGTQPQQVAKTPKDESMARGEPLKTTFR